MRQFSEESEQLIRDAFALACEYGHSCVGTSHLLLALLRQRCLLPARLLCWAGLRYEQAERRLLAERGRGRRLLRLPQGLTARAQRILTLAAADAAPRRILPEHLLTAITREPDCGACRLLRQNGIDTTLLFTNLCEALRVRAQTERGNSMQSGRLLEQFGTDLAAKADKMETIVGREAEIETLMQVLSRKHKHNPALIGEPGVGKTAIVEGFAQRLAAGQVPEQLLGKRLFALDMASMVAGTKYRGEFEERVRDLLLEVRRAGNMILFVDEMHTLIGAGSAEGAIDAANIIKPALGRGELQMIGATTLQEYRKYIEKDAALERRFRPILVSEPSEAETAGILRALRPGLEQHHNVKISDEAITAAVELSSRYISDRFLPDKAVDLLDEGAAQAWLQMGKSAQNAERRALQERLGAAVREGRYEQAALLRDRVQNMTVTCARRPRVVTAQDIAANVANRTGIPAGLLSATDKQRLRTLESDLKQCILGQDEAVRQVAAAVRRGRSGLAEACRPMASMLFTGPTGVGKTALCQALARLIYGTQDALIRLDMSEYMEKFSVSRLIGAPPGYVGHGDGGELTEKVRRKPYSLVLFDELDKAHRDVCGLLLQIMEDGALTDSLGRKVNFKNTILVMTCNLGAQGKRELGFGGDLHAAAAKSALREAFPPEFLGRIDCVSVFHPLEETALRQIAQRQLDELCARASGVGLTLTLSAELPGRLAALCCRTQSGARQLRHLVQAQIESPLSLLLCRQKPPRSAQILLEGDEICVRSEGEELSV